MRQRSGGEPVLIYIDDDSFPEALRFTGSYTIAGDQVRIKAFLRKDGQTVATLPELTAQKETVADELLKAVRNALALIR